MTHDEISQLAIELTSQAAAEVQESLSFTRDEGGCPVLIVKSRESVLHFNPYRWAVAIIAKQARKAEFQLKGDVEAQKKQVIKASRREIIELLTSVNSWLSEILRVLSDFSEVALIQEDLGPFYQDVQVNLKLTILQAMDSQFRKLFGLPEKSQAIEQAERDELTGGNYDYAITDSQMLAALKKLDRFSIKRLAQLLAPERDDFRPSVYDWMRRKGVDRAVLESWWRKFHGGVEKSD